MITTLRNNKNNKGFTLVELIVVIVILGILAVVAAPKLMSFKLEAKNAALKGFAAALESHAYMFHAKAVMAGVDEETGITNNFGSSSKKYFDYVTGMFYDEDKGYDFAKETQCKNSPTCNAMAFGYPSLSPMSGFSGIMGKTSTNFYPGKTLNVDSSFSYLNITSMPVVVFYFTEDQSFVTSSRFYQTFYPFALPCSVTYIKATLQKNVYLDIGVYDPTINYYANTGKKVPYPADRKPHVSVQPCTK